MIIFGEPPETITAQLSGDNVASALDHEVRSTSPVLALCRHLIAAGHDPSTPMECWRGDTLCLRVSSIGAAAFGLCLQTEVAAQ